MRLDCIEIILNKVIFLIYCIFNYVIFNLKNYFVLYNVVFKLKGINLRLSNIYFFSIFEINFILSKMFYEFLVYLWVLCIFIIL